MEALIIAAGKGSRLNHRFSPKPLLPIYGLRLIERIILTAKLAGIHRFKIVVGYKADEIMKTIGSGEKYGVHIEYIVNPEWEKGNGVSVSKAKQYLKGDFILLMSDHLFDESILKKLKQIDLDDARCILCVDRNLDGNHFSVEDVTKVRMEKDSVRNIGKNIDRYNAIDTGIFLCTPVIFEALEESISKGEYSLSAGNQVLSKTGKLRTFDITGDFWIDVDDGISLKKARKILLRNLVKLTDGPIAKSLNRPISTRISSKLANYSIMTPNLLTLFSFLLALLSAAFFFLGTYAWIIAGGVMAQLSSVMDGCDGEIARLKFKYSQFGKWLDRILDRYADSFIILGMTHACWLASSNEFVWLAGFLALTGTFLNSYTALPYDEEILKKKLWRKRGWIRVGRDMRLFIIFVGALLNQLFFTLILLALLTNIESIRRLFILRNAYKYIQKGSTGDFRDHLPIPHPGRLPTCQER